jgi:hypothetical protein
MRGLLKDGLQTEAEEEGAQHTSLSRPPFRGHTANQAFPIKKMERRGHAVT